MQSVGQQVSVGEVLSSWFSSLGRHAPICLLAGGLLTATGALLDLAMGEQISQLPNAIVGFIVQYLLVEYILIRDYALRPGKRRYLSAFGAALLATLGILVGIVFLILPGLYLGARWSLANALVIGEGYTSVDALKESWKRTSASAWVLVGCLLVVALGTLVAAFALGALLVVPGVQGSFIETLSGNLLGAVISISYSVLGCVVYGLISKPEGALDDVFS